MTSGHPGIYTSLTDVTKMRCVKLLGQPLSARDFDRQVAEFQVRVAVLIVGVFLM